MNSFFALILFFGASTSFAQNSCPDASGQFRGSCIEVSSCHPSRGVRYGANIQQRGCSEIEMSFVASSGKKVLFKVDEKNEIFHGGHVLINTFVTYSGDDLVRIEKHGNNEFVEVLRKIQKDGEDFLQVDLAGTTGKCTVSTSCLLPSVK